MFIVRNGSRIISVILAICVWLTTYMLLRVVIPGPIYMEELPESYYARRALLGTIVFMVAVIVLSVFSDIHFLQKTQNESQWKPPSRNEYIEIISLSLRFIFSGYFAMFWYNHLIYVWFSRISLSFAYTYSALYYQALIACLVIACFLGAFWIVYEPWRKFAISHKKVFLYRILLIRVTVYLVLNIYFAAFMLFRFPTDIGFIFGNTVFLIVSSVLLGVYKPFKSIREQ
jgi:hypothetical protein